MLSTLVTNQQPGTDNTVPATALALFEQYCLAQSGQVYSLFLHQADVFRHVLADREVFLIAGTAAGKTLAMGTPLFDKLATGGIRKILFLYPTIALMEDQRRVMDGLAALTPSLLPGGAEMGIGLIQGGMTRATLIEALNKPVILATPDAIYWFFRKNVKYSSLLIYGLALLDEVVIDEAHLFNGIMLQNLLHLKQRVQLLRERMGKSSRWHILTATPTPELYLLSQGREVRGHSKCGDVTVQFHAPLPPTVKGSQYQQASAQRMISAVDDGLMDGAQKVLAVFNAADAAHRLFTQVQGSQKLRLPTDLLWKFGRVPWGELEPWLLQEALASETINEISTWLRQQFPVYLKSVPVGMQSSVAAETFVRCLSQLLEEYQGSLQRVITLAAKDKHRGLPEAVQATLGRTSKASRLLWEGIAPTVPARAGQSEVLRALERWIEQTTGALELALTHETLTVTSPDFPEIGAVLHQVGIGTTLAQMLTKALSSLVRLSEQDAGVLAVSPSLLNGLKGQMIGLAALPCIIQDQARSTLLVQLLRHALEQGHLKVEARHIAIWKNTAIPVLLYTGKMARAERDGLIDAFASLPHAILLSTSAVEVGVDFAADSLVTEECDGNAFLQRFGRVGRRTGMQGKVVVFLKNGQTYAKLVAAASLSMSRDAFSDLIAHPTTGIFPRRLYVGHSLYVEAIHWLINRQLGAIGEWLNLRMFSSNVTSLAEQVQASGSSFGFGLRATLPTISLKHGAGSADPFYLLRILENDDLLLSDSPFEFARSEVPYEKVLWQKPFWQAVTVDIEAALEESQILFWWEDGSMHLQSRFGIGADYVRLLELTAGSYGEPYKRLFADLSLRITQDRASLLTSLRERNPDSPLVHIGEALPLLFEPHARLILGQGTVQLLRLDKDGVTIPVEDRLGSPLVLSDQMWLLLYGYDQHQVLALLQAISAERLEEIVYDWWSLQQSHGKYLFLLDRSAGACFAVYQRLVQYVTSGSL